MYFSIWINAKYWKLECEDVIFFFSFELLCISRYGFFSSRLILKNFKNIRNTSCVKKFTYFCSFLNLTKIPRIIQSSFIFSYKETTSINSLSLSGLSDESMEANLRHHELDYFVRDIHTPFPPSLPPLRGWKSFRQLCRFPIW